jgi:hypothetical protein
LLKQISFIKALAGGQLAATEKGMITTGSADYLVVNAQGKKFHVWSTKEIA